EAHHVLHRAGHVAGVGLVRIVQEAQQLHRGPVVVALGEIGAQEAVLGDAVRTLAGAGEAVDLREVPGDVVDVDLVHHDAAAGEVVLPAGLGDHPGAAQDCTSAAAAGRSTGGVVA